METKSEFGRVALVSARAFLVAAMVMPLAAQVTSRISIVTGGAEGNDHSRWASISGDGRYVAYESEATNLVSGDTNDAEDVFVYDRQAGTTERVSVDSAEMEGGFRMGSIRPAISADGRCVVFESYAELVPGNPLSQNLYVRDRQLGTTERVSVNSSGVVAAGNCAAASISADGRFVAFASDAANLVAGDTNSTYDVFLRDRQLGTTERVSLGSGGAQGNGFSSMPDISADGRFVAFWSHATNLVGGDTNGWEDVFVRDRQLGLTELVSVDSSGAQSNWRSHSASISGDGRCVAFWSIASNLVAVDTNGSPDVFLRDLQLGTTELVSVDSAEAQGSGTSASPSASFDGRYVAFQSEASSLVGGDTNFAYDIFLRDRQLGTTQRASLLSGGGEGNSWAFAPSISADGGYVAFGSFATNYIPGDTNGFEDIFVRDLLGGPSFTSLCDPGVGGVIACPCGNPPSGPGRGCDNSASTGGAILSAGGGTYLSSDSLFFTTSGEKPTALSIVSQWTGTNPTGVVFGQGVRCTSGTLKRLYTKTASGGSITAPNFGAGDLQVSVRSAALGDTILAGQSRRYVVYYRDPNVLGGCPSTSTFNATQTGEVAWSP